MADCLLPDGIAALKNMFFIIICRCLMQAGRAASSPSRAHGHWDRRAVFFIGKIAAVGPKSGEFFVWHIDGYEPWPPRCGVADESSSADLHATDAADH
jgi:hypothetical protein